MSTPKTPICLLTYHQAVAFCGHRHASFSTGIGTFQNQGLCRNVLFATVPGAASAVQYSWRLHPLRLTPRHSHGVVPRTRVRCLNYKQHCLALQMTGRKGRVVSNDDGSISYESRSELDVPVEILNITEKQRFMDGDKVRFSGMQFNGENTAPYI